MLKKRHTDTNDDEDHDEESEGPNTENFIVHRDNILEDTLLNFFNIDPKHINSNLEIEITFAGEAGIDQGGLRNEWLTLLTKELFDPKRGLFKLSANKLSVQPSPLVTIIPNGSAYMKLAGRIVGYSISKNQALNVSFTKPFLKQLIEAQISVSDLNDVDPELFRSLEWLLNNSIEGVIEQNFAYEFDFLGDYFTISLSEDKSSEVLTDSNKKEYVKKLCQQKLVTEIKEQINEFKAGLYEFIPLNILKLFLAPELETLISGKSQIDVEDMQKYMKYEECSPEENFIKYFWNVIKSFDQDNLSAFLFFVTGYTKVSFGGFKDNPLRILRSSGDKSRLPLAHTCFNQIELPVYDSEEEMRIKLLTAILEGKGFHMV